MGNSIPSAGSIGLAFAPQNTDGTLAATLKSSAGGYSAVGDDDFQIMPVLGSQFGLTESVQPYGNEVDQGYHPPGLYKEFYWGAGQASLYPRLNDAIGYLLFGIVGSCTGGTAAVADTSLDKTTFAPPADLLDFPWMTFRRFVNGPSGGSGGGTELRDSRVASAQFSMGAGSPMGLQLGLLSLTPNQNAAFSTFGDDMSDPNEDVTTTPHALEGVGPTLTQIAGKGTLGDESAVAQSAMGVTIGITNQFSASNPRQELIIGKETPDDAILTGQTFTFEFALKWKDFDLWRAILNGGHNSYTWDPDVARTELDFVCGTPYQTSSLPMKLHFHAAEVAWQTGPVTLAPRGFLTTTLTGVAIKQSSPSSYFTVGLENDVEYSGISYS